MRISDAKRRWSPAMRWLCCGGAAGGALLIVVFLLAFTGLGGRFFSTTTAAVLSPTGRLAWAHWCIPDDAVFVTYANFDRLRASPAYRALRNVTESARECMPWLEVFSRYNVGIFLDPDSIAMHGEPIGVSREEQALSLRELFMADGANGEQNIVFRTREDASLERAAGAGLRVVMALLHGGTTLDNANDTGALETSKTKTLGDIPYVDFGERGVVAKAASRTYFVARRVEHLQAALRRRERGEGAVASEGLRRALENTAADHCFRVLSRPRRQEGPAAKDRASWKALPPPKPAWEGVSVHADSQIEVRGILGFSDANAAAAYQKDRDEYERIAEDDVRQLSAASGLEACGYVAHLSRTRFALQFQQEDETIQFHGHCRVDDLEELHDALRMCRSTDRGHPESALNGRQ